MVNAAFNTEFHKLVLSESVLLGSSRVRIQSLYPQSKSNREVPSSNRQFLTVKNRQPDKGKETETCLTRYDYLTERSQKGIKWRMYILFGNPTRLSNRCDFFFSLALDMVSLTKMKC